MEGSRAGGVGPNDRQPLEQLRASRAAGLCLCGVILEMEVHGCLSVPCEAGHRGGKAEMSSGPLAAWHVPLETQRSRRRTRPGASHIHALGLLLCLGPTLRP